MFVVGDVGVRVGARGSRTASTHALVEVVALSGAFSQQVLLALCLLHMGMLLVGEPQTSLYTYKLPYVLTLPFCSIF